MPEQPTGTKRGAGALALASAASGLLAYGVFATSTRALGPEAAAPVSVLWTWWGFAGAAVTFPLQHWTTRTVTEHGEGAVRHALGRVLGLVLGAAGVTLLAAWLARDALFRDGGIAFPLLAALVVLGSALVGVNRGSLGARRRYAAVGASLLAENGLRLALVLVAAAAGADDPLVFGLCLVAGHLSAFAWPSSFRFADGPGAGAGSPLAFLAGAGAGQLGAQVALTAGPVVLALAGGSPVEVTALFAALALFRAPYMLAQGSVAPLTVRLTQLVVERRHDVLRRLRLGILALTAVAVPLAALVGWWAGPPLLPAIFGDGVHLGAGPCAVVAAGCALAIVNLLTVVDLLAHDRPGAVAGSWAAGLAAGVAGFVALLSLEPVGRSAGAFLVAEAVALAALLVLLPREPADEPDAPVSRA